MAFEHDIDFKFLADTIGGYRLELGAGGGLVGYAIHLLDLWEADSILSRLALALALDKASITGSRSHIHLSDIPPMLPLLEHNISLNPTTIAVKALSLSWGEPLPSTLDPPDVILAADCCYFEPAFPLLLDTLDELLRSKEGSVCYFCFKKRRKADLGFVKMARKRFEVVDGGLDDPERSTWQREGIFL